MDIVLNWIWQGGVVALATAVVLTTISPARAPTRYAVAWAGLVSVLALPLIFTVSIADPAAGARITRMATADTSSSLPYLSIPHRWLISGAAITVAWLGWVTINGITLLMAMLALRRAKRACHPLPSDIEEQLPHWLDIRGSGRRATIVISAAVRHAAVLGRARTIAIAPHLVDRLDRGDLDRIVVHEWAHLQRRDDMAQVALLAIRTIAGWHPAIWWLNRQIAIEREIACDQLAVAVTGSPKKYAACLMRLAAMPSRSFSPAVGLHVLTLLHSRILRVLSLKDVRPQGAHVPATVAAAVMLIGTGLGVGRFQLIVTAPASTVRASPDGRNGSTVRDTTTGNRTMSVRLIPDMTIAANSDRSRFAASLDTGRHDAGDTPARVWLRPVAAIAANDDVRTPLRPDATISALSHDLQIPQKPDTTAETTRDNATATPASTPLESSGPVAIWHAPEANSDSTFSATDQTPTTPWEAAADGGIAVSRVSQKAAGATAGFFTRFGKRVATSF